VTLALPGDDAAWDRITFGAAVFEGNVKVTGPALKNKNNHRRARGRSGRTPRHTGRDAVELHFELTAWTDEHLVQLESVRDVLFPAQTERQGAAAVAVVYPALQFARITEVLPDDMSLPDPQADGSVKVTIKVTQHLPPSTTTTTSRTPAAADDEEQYDEDTAAVGTRGRWGTIVAERAPGATIEEP
jgi:hypothetical protein